MNTLLTFRPLLYSFLILFSIHFLSISGIGSSAIGQTLTDYDGNEYQTVIIGYQEWMAENLRTTHFSNGTPIAEPGSDNDAWESDTTGALTWYNNDDSWADAYGALYNWYAVNSEHGICPEGWRVPSSDDRWDLLNYAVDHLEIELSDVGNALKSCRQIDSPLGGPCDTGEHPRWNAHDTEFGTDDLGFSATPGGFRSDGGFSGFMGSSANFWTSTESSTEGRAIAMGLSSRNSYTTSSNSNLNYGYSIRCLRDVVATLPEMGAAQEASEIRATHATSGGVVSKDGGAPVTERGMVWSQNPGPTLEEYEGKTVDGSGTGEFTSRLLGLQPASTYYARAYATNIEGTSYTEAITFTTSDPVEPVSETPAGSGSEQDPYLISSLNHLTWISENPDSWNKNFLQTADIDASATSDWTDGKGWNSIGTGELSGFTGVYDGGGHHIDHLFLNREESGQGLFGYITDGAIIRNLGIREADIHGGEWYVGALVGYSAASYIDACFTTGSVRGTKTNVGGLAGRLHHKDGQGSTLSNSYSTCDVYGVSHVGGLVGVNAPEGCRVYHCYSTGRVTGEERYVNPLVGRDFTSSQTPVSNYWNLETAGLDRDSHASGKTTRQMQFFGTFLKWDFKGEERNGTENIWNIGNERNGGLPYLSWQYPDDPGITAEFEGGSGTEEDPFLINTAKQLALINFQYLSSHDSEPEEFHFKLIRDINLDAKPFNEGEGWEPIGTTLVPHFLPLENALYFRGVFDGDNHVVRGLFIDRLKSYQGLFGLVYKAEIKNLGVWEANVTGGTRYLGVLAGQITDSQINDCFTTGSVQGAGDIFFSFNGTYSGGLAGNVNEGSVITNSYSRANVSGSSQCGGLAGNVAESTVAESFSTGTVTSLGASGGLVGTLHGGAVVRNSYSHSEVVVRVADDESIIGGFVGSNHKSRVTNSYSTGKITTLQGSPPSNKGFSGRITDEDNGDFHMAGNYWDTESSEQEGSTSGDGAIGKSTEEMTFPHAGDAFSGWDFEDVWKADENKINNGYPFLRNTKEVAVPPNADGLTPGDELPREVTLLQNYPNPFNPVTSITFDLPEAAEVRLEVFDVTGRRVALLVDERRQAGRYQAVFDASGLASGVYIGRLLVGTEGGGPEAGNAYTRTMTLVK